MKRNVAAGRKFSEMLSEALNRYQNRTIDAAQVIAEIVETGFEIVIVGVRDGILDREWLGRRIDDSFIDDLAARARVNANGSAHRTTATIQRRVVILGNRMAQTSVKRPSTPWARSALSCSEFGFARRGRKRLRLASRSALYDSTRTA